MPPLHPTGQGVSAAAGQAAPLRLAIGADVDVLTARAATRELAANLNLSPIDLTAVATAVSEVCRNIVRFAGSGELVAELVTEPRRGIRITASDAGPGIKDVELALLDGVSSYGGLGLGLPGTRRLMDDFTIASQPGQGTTVTMVKWQRSQGDPP
jgi:serine/threonine-protein kinase RsbT